MKENKPSSKADDRFWELSGGIFRCGHCDRGMATHATFYKRKDGEKARYHYYRCQNAVTHRELCLHRRSYKADRLEGRVWGLVSGFLKEPERLEAGLEEMIRREERSLNRNPRKQFEIWRDKISEADEKRRRYQEMAAEGLIDFGELRERLSELDEKRNVAEREIEALRNK